MTSWRHVTRRLLCLEGDFKDAECGEICLSILNDHPNRLWGNEYNVRLLPQKVISNVHYFQIHLIWIIQLLSGFKKISITLNPWGYARGNWSWVGFKLTSQFVPITIKNAVKFIIIAFHKSKIINSFNHQNMWNLKLNRPIKHTSLLAFHNCVTKIKKRDFNWFSKINNVMVSLDDARGEKRY